MSGFFYPLEDALHYLRLGELTAYTFGVGLIDLRRVENCLQGIGHDLTRPHIGFSLSFVHTLVDGIFPGGAASFSVSHA